MRKKVVVPDGVLVYMGLLLGPPTHRDREESALWEQVLHLFDDKLRQVREEARRLAKYRPFAVRPHYPDDDRLVGVRGAPHRPPPRRRLFPKVHDPFNDDHALLGVAGTR